jgi:hypothetical protein
MEMQEWEQFTNLKQRGEWVELQFMAAVAQRRFTVCRPWGDTAGFDVGVEYPPNFLRVQVKSSACRLGKGYWCQFTRYCGKKDYTLEEIDLFAAYVIPVNAWYLIPASELLGSERIRGLMLYPVDLPVRKNTFRYECYKEAWWLLTKSRRGLARYGR